MSGFPFEGKIKHVINEKSGTRHFASQIANRLIHTQMAKDLARSDLNHCNGDYRIPLLTRAALKPEAAL